MKIFVSWSGPRIRAVAELISDWIKCVIQASQPWISTRDIDRGAIWFSEISDQLKNTSAGIVCLTQENKSKPWILFETGALAKGLTSSRVCTFLVDLEPSDLEDPLAQFNHTLPTKAGLKELVNSLNRLLDNGLDQRILEQVFETYWTQFEEGFKAALSENPPSVDVPPRAESDILVEILNSTRSVNQRVRELEVRMDTEKERIRRRKRGKRDAPPSELRAIETIAKLVRDGRTDDLIVNQLIDYDMPTGYIHGLINRVRSDIGIDNPIPTLG